VSASPLPPARNGDPAGNSKPSPEVVRLQLDRILASALFTRSPRLTAFLRYVVEQTLAGRGDGLKEQVLALELYGRGGDFEAGLDPIVRVDARRLRDKLREFYAESPGEAVTITLPKGSYVPVFEFVKTAPQLPRTPTSLTATDITAPTRRQLIRLGTVAAVGIAPISAVLLYFTKSNNPSPATLRPLASLPGLKGPPSLSPDGNMVVFFWSGPAEKPAPGLYIKSVDGEDLRWLTAADATADPAWSPRGSEIAFSRSGPEGGVFVVSQVDRSERKISDSGTSVAWTAEATAVLFRDAFLADNMPGALRQGLFAVSLKTLEKHQLTRPEAPVGDVKAAVSPDGTTLAFIRSGIPGLCDVYVMPMTGGEPRRVTDWNSRIEGLAWTPDGKDIIYGVYEPVGPRLWRIPAGQSPPGRHADRGADG
jgi:hypothetical protein